MAINATKLFWGAIIGAIVVPITSSLYTSLTGSSPSIMANYTWTNVVSGAITGAVVVAALELVGKE